MKYIVVILSILGILTLGGCKYVRKDVNDDAPVVEKEYKIDDANSLVIKDIHLKQGTNYFGANVYLCEGEEKKIVISTIEGINDKITVEESSGCINIYGSKYENYVTKAVNIYIYNYQFDNVTLSNVKGEVSSSSLSNDDVYLKLSGASNITIDSISCDELDINVSGASKLDVDNIKANSISYDESGASKINTTAVNAKDVSFEISGASTFTGQYNSDNVKLNLSGSSEAKISGVIADADIDASGSSDINLKDCSVNTCDISLSGSSDLNISINSSLKGNASGASEVVYYGNGSVNVSTSGASTVKRG